MRARDVPDRLRQIAERERTVLHENTVAQLLEAAEAIEQEPPGEAFGRTVDRTLKRAQPALEAAAAGNPAPRDRRPWTDAAAGHAPTRVRAFLESARAQIAEVDALAEAELEVPNTPRSGRNLDGRLVLTGRAVDDLIDGIAHLTRFCEHQAAGARVCGAVEPNASAANAAVCDRPAGHDGYHAGAAQGPAAAERPGTHRWATLGLSIDDLRGPQAARLFDRTEGE